MNNKHINFLIVLIAVLCMASSTVVSNDDNELSKAIFDKKVVLEDLKLYSVIKTIQGRIDADLKDLVQKQGYESKKASLFAAAKLAATAVSLMQSIVDDFNAGSFAFNLELKFRFLEICNGFGDLPFEEIEPRNIREQALKFEKFNRYVTTYCLCRRDFLSKSDLDLFNKITQFNQILLFCLLHEDFFDIDFVVKAMDWTVYRPSSFIYEHRWSLLTAAALLTVGALFYHYYLSEPAHPYALNQFQGLMQRSNQCGYFAAVHANAIAGARTEDEVRARLEVLQQQDQRVRDGIPAATQFLGRPADAGVENLANEEVEQILHAGFLGQRQAVPVIQNPIDLDQIIDPAVAAFYPSINMFNQGRRDLREHQVPQTAVVRVHNGHWVTLHVMPDVTRPEGIRAVAIDSSIGRLGNNPTIVSLLQRYAPIPVPVAV